VTETPLTEVMNGAARPDGGGGAQGSIPLPKRSAAKGLLPGTWVGRTLRVAYVDCYGGGQEATAALLDLYPFGVIVNLSGERTALSWDCLRTVTLVSD
jgi:hypothetical protein